MKSKKKRRQFVSINDYYKNNQQKSNSIQSSLKIKPGEEYKTSLELLTEQFPKISPDTIEDIYRHNFENYYKAKNYLDSISSNNHEDYIDMNAYNAEDSESSIYSNQKSFANDITHFAKFEIDSDVNINYGENNKQQAEKLNNNNNILKKTKEYETVFQNEELPYYIKINQETPQDEETYIDAFLIEEYVSLLNEFFPNYSRVEITKKICDFDFDIDKVVLSFFDCNSPSKEELTNLENFDISNKEEILNNFSSFDCNNNNKIDFDIMAQHSVQFDIENEIKKENIRANFKWNNNDNNNINNNKNDSNIKESEEYFLDKNINQIQTKKIKDDLIQLKKDFPLEDEFTLKWIYYQYMNYNLCHHYLSKECKTMKTGLKGLFESMEKREKNKIKKDNILKENKQDKQEKTLKSQKREVESEEKRRGEILSQIICKHPENWKFENDICNENNLRDYQSIRKKLIWQANLLFTAKRFQEAKSIMAKARRYKQEINKILTQKKINDFIRNNRHLSYENKHSREHFIDLHGMSLEESRIIITKKIEQLSKVNQRSSRIILSIITGIGIHSKNKAPVLLPGLSSWLKNSGYKVKVNNSQGIISVFL